MMIYIKRFFRWQGRFFFSTYGPTVLTIIFALLQVHFFPDGPIWTIGIFFIVVMVIFGRYVKW